MHPFEDLDRTPQNHFKLHLMAAASATIQQFARTLGTYAGVFEQFPFLSEYDTELAGCEPDTLSLESVHEWWSQILADWEEPSSVHLPIRALRRDFALGHSALMLLMCVGWIEEDPRAGLLFESSSGDRAQFPSLGWLASWSRLSGSAPVRREVQRLAELGFLRIGNVEAPRSEWLVQTNNVLWDILRGETHDHPAPWARYQPPDRAWTIEDLILSDGLGCQVRNLPRLLSARDIDAVIVRGPEGSGRRTLLTAISRQLGLGTLVASGSPEAMSDRWQVLGTMATMLRAMPIVMLDVAPGESICVPEIRAFGRPAGIVLGRQGGISGPITTRSITLTTEMPDIDARRLHWQRGFGDRRVGDLDCIAERYRMSAGCIGRVASAAASFALLDGRDEVNVSDVHAASRTLNRQVLDTLAVHVPVSGDWKSLATGDTTDRELRHLESRCRSRERLHRAVGPALLQHLTPGVRALFSGPSGTGKTLASRILAAVLEKDLYRLDLSTVVNKYIGETEKNLSRIFARVEELDVILLLDEGDALLTQRTNVQSSNDRYANLETNYLLQRLESFEGIVIVTTNAGDRIDSAFQRRMDVVIDFPAPDADQRRRIWDMHLPVGHRVSASLLAEVVGRCELTGGQIRNAALHVAALALDQSPASDAQLEAAVRREYRKAGAVCPLRENTLALFVDRW